jgi:hypothetical protein
VCFTAQQFKETGKRGIREKVGESRALNTRLNEFLWQQGLFAMVSGDSGISLKIGKRVSEMVFEQ